MIKAGDLFKNMDSGKVFAVKGTFPSVIILETKDKFHSMFVNSNNMESMFLPYIEDDGNQNPRKDLLRKWLHFPGPGRKENLCSILMRHVPIVSKSSNSTGSFWKGRSLYDVPIAEGSLRQTTLISKK
jgi:hypothetical protein